MRWLIAAGGTGGHVFPALSVATALREMDRDADIVFVGTDRGLESRTIPPKGFKLKIVKGAAGIVGLGWKAKLRTLVRLPRIGLQCLYLLLSFRPHLVLGMGGFSAGPTVLMASILGFPTAIAEQNAVAGRTNKALGRFVKRIFLTFEESKEGFDQSRVTVTGNPVRSEILEGAKNATKDGWDPSRDKTLNLLVFGGSQGARGINDAMEQAMARLRALPFSIEVLHQTGKQQVEELQNAYDAADIHGTVVPFIHNMEAAYARAHLVVCRSGAASLAEIALFGKPTVLVPFPHAADDHQLKNARIFETKGAAVVLEQKDLNGDVLAEVVERLTGDPGRLQEMGRNAGTLAKPDAANDIARECMALARGSRKHVQTV